MMSTIPSIKRKTCTSDTSSSVSHYKEDKEEKTRQAQDSYRGPRRLVKEPPRPLEFWVRSLSDPDKNTREWAVGHLGISKDPRAVGPLTASLKDPETYIRAMAARALGDFGDPAAVEPLVEALDDPDQEVRFWADWALKQLVMVP